MVNKKEQDNKKKSSATSKKLCKRAIKIARRSIGEKNACLLETLCYLKKKQRASFLRDADNNLIKCIQECIFNTLRGNVPLDSKEKKRLIGHRAILRRIASKQGNLKDKKNCWCSGEDSYLILSYLYSLLYCLELSEYKETHFSLYISYILICRKSNKRKKRIIKRKILSNE